VDGSFDVHSTSGDALVQVNKLFPKSSSSVECLLGSVTALLDPEVRYVVFTPFHHYRRRHHKIMSTTNNAFVYDSTQMSLNVKCFRLEEEREQTKDEYETGELLPKEHRNIIVESDSFEGYIRNDRECLGFFSGESSMVKRPEFNSKSANKSGMCSTYIWCLVPDSLCDITYCLVVRTGKIDLRGAEELSLRRSVTSEAPSAVFSDDASEMERQLQSSNRRRVMSKRQVQAAEAALSDPSKKLKTSPDMRAELKITAKEIIRLETISWIGRIKRNHGF
jgi:hypothetical protein